MPLRLIIAYSMIAAIAGSFLWWLWRLTERRRHYYRHLLADHHERRLEERLKRVAKAKDAPEPQPRNPVQPKPRRDR